MQLTLDSEDRLLIELDVFSGRPNPVWELTEAERSQLAAMARKLPNQTGVWETSVEKLGYRGLIVRGSKLFDELRVHEGLVEGNGNRWVDVGRSIEAFLLATSRPHLESAIYERVISLAKMGEQR